MSASPSAAATARVLPADAPAAIVAAAGLPRPLAYKDRILSDTLVVARRHNPDMGILKLSGALADEIERLGKALFGTCRFSMELGLFFDTRPGYGEFTTHATNLLRTGIQDQFACYDLTDKIIQWRGTVLPASCDVDFYCYAGERGKPLEGTELKGNLELRFTNGVLTHYFDGYPKRDFVPYRKEDFARKK